MLSEITRPMVPLAITVMVLAGAGFALAQVDRGLPVEASDSEITSERADGDTVTLEVTDHTAWRGVE